MNVQEILSTMIEDNTPLNAILREVDYDLPPDQMAKLRNMLIDKTVNPYFGGNKEIYRKVSLPNEVRLEYLSGVPGIDLPFIGDVAVNTVDFTFDKKKKNFLSSYQFRRGPIRYRFNPEKMTLVDDGIYIITALLENDQTIAIGRFDQQPGFILVNKRGYSTIGVEKKIKGPFTYATVGYRNDRIILHYSIL